MPVNWFGTYRQTKFSGQNCSEALVRYWLNCNPFDLIERDLVAGAVVELGRPWRLVGRDSLGVFDGAAVLQVGSDAGGPEGVAAGGRGESGFFGAALDHPQHVHAVHGIERNMPV